MRIMAAKTKEILVEARGRMKSDEREMIEGERARA
jgi:hypothetical protein